MGSDKTATDPASMGSGAMGSTGVASGSMDSSTSSTTTMDHSADSASLKSVTGQVAKVDQDQGSITLDQSAGGVTLTIDSQTKVLRRGRQANGISAIREGEQVRASFDPTSNRADKIELMGKHHGMHHHAGTTTPSSSGSTTGGRSDSTPSDLGHTSTDSAISPAAPSGNKAADMKSSDTTNPDKK